MTGITDHSAHGDSPKAVATRLAEVDARVRNALVRAGRAADDVVIVAVSKRQPAEAVQAAYHAGQHRFGESYVQEALPKIERLAGLGVEWHFIGRMQSNKTRAIAEHFDWVHTVDRQVLARRLNDQRPAYAPPLNVLIQVSLAGETQKGGIAPGSALQELVEALAGQPRLKLRGLMTIPPADLDADTALERFLELRRMFEELTSRGADLDTLSMGMSGDFEIAIAAGSTCVRIGTAIFGERD